MLDPIPKTLEASKVLAGLHRQPTDRVVLLYSAGADSTAAGLKMVEAGLSVHPLFIDYGQTALQAEEYLALTAPTTLGFQATSIVRMAEAMKSLSNSALLGENSANDMDAWVPARNTLFTVLAGIYGCQIDADRIVIGFMADDQGVYGDSNYLHHQLAGLLLTQSLSRPMPVDTPLKSLTKKEVLKYLLAQGAIDLTVSCWNAQLEDRVVQACHRCTNCQERDGNLALIEQQSGSRVNTIDAAR